MTDSHPRIFKNLALMTTDAAVPDLSSLQHLVPLGGLRPEKLRDLARKARIGESAAGEFLFSAGDSAKEAIWVLEGTVGLINSDGRTVATVTGGSEEALHRLAHQSPRTVSARCETAVRWLAIDASLLDVMLTWDQTGSFEVGELAAEADSDDWMARLLAMPVFQMVPPANLQAMFMRMQKVQCEPGEVIIKQGDPGDYFYVLVEGRALVTREHPNQKPIRLAELEPGACFGEEALISDGARNATVTMLTRGALMRLSKDDFRELLNEPLARRLPPEDARALVDAGKAVWLDVRLPSEFRAGSLPGALNIPLYMLRLRLSSLPTDKSQVCVCDSGRRSSVAAFVLTEKGYDAYVLDGGLSAGQASPSA